MTSIPEKEISYVDYETFLSPDFSPSLFANSLVLSTNNASDTNLDLSTPLSRTLFDLQEVDTHIHTLTTQSALPLLIHTQQQTQAAQRISSALESQVQTLQNSYSRLENEVIGRHAAVEEVRLAAARIWVTLKIGRAVQRALTLGRQLERQMADVRPSLTAARSRGGDDHRSMVAAADTLLALRALFAADRPGMEGEHLSRIAVVNTLRHDLIEPSESRLRGKAQQIVREFALTSTPTSAIHQQAGPTDSRSSSPAPAPATASAATTTSYAQTAETKARMVSAIRTLYLLSLLPAINSGREGAQGFAPTLLLTALQTYLQTSLTSSAAGLSRSLAQLPTLPRALQEVIARCRNVVALEALLASTETPENLVLPLLKPKTSVQSTQNINGSTAYSNGNGQVSDRDGLGPNDEDDAEVIEERGNLLTPLLEALDTSSLTSYFWRSLASGMSNKVAEIVNRGGAPARSLRSQRDRLRENIRDSVLRACEGAKQPDGRTGESVWEREAAVMVASVVGPLGR